jgi:hypothetical protein
MGKKREKKGKKRKKIPITEGNAEVESIRVFEVIERSCKHRPVI